MVIAWPRSSSQREPISMSKCLLTFYRMSVSPWGARPHIARVDQTTAHRRLRPRRAACTCDRLPGCSQAVVADGNQSYSILHKYSITHFAPKIKGLSAQDSARHPRPSPSRQPHPRLTPSRRAPAACANRTGDPHAPAPPTRPGPPTGARRPIPTRPAPEPHSRRPRAWDAPP